MFGLTYLAVCFLRNSLNKQANEVHVQTKLRPRQGGAALRGNTLIFTSVSHQYLAYVPRV